MRVARTIDELFSGGDEPRCYLGRRCLFWAADERLGGHAVWGCPDLSDAEEFVDVLERGIAAGDRTPARLVIDFGELVACGTDAFDVVARYFARHRGEIDAEGAVVRPGGALGAMVAGFYDVVGHAPRMPIVTTVAEACVRLGRADAVPVAEEVYRLRDQRGGAHDTVDRLRGLLAETQPPASLAEAARAVQMSRRTLQHRLQLAGTSYRDERRRVRLDRAKHLLGAGLELTAVALDVGFSTPQHFSTWFKRETGATPSSWRTKHAAAAGDGSADDDDGDGNTHARG